MRGWRALIGAVAAAGSLALAGCAHAASLGIQMSPANGAMGFQMLSGRFWTQQPSLVLRNYCPPDPTGKRQQKAWVKFEKPFKKPPLIIIAIDGLDVGHSRNLRVKAYAEGVTGQGATIVVETWCNTNLYALSGSFTAIGWK